MRDYGRIFSSFWTSGNAQLLSDDGRLLALYLLSCQHGTIAGVCRLPDGYVCEDLKWEPARVKKGFMELFDNGFANRCETSKWVWICKHFDWNLPENPNQWKAARKIAAQVPDECLWKACFLYEFAAAAGDELPPKPNPSGRVTKTVSEPVSVSVSVSEAVTVAVTESKKVPSEPVKQKLDGPVEKIFSHWKSVHGHLKASLDPKRRKVIQGALKHYSEADLCQSISGYLNSPHHIGENPNNTRYDALELLLRDAQHIDAGLKFARAPPKASSSVTDHNIRSLTEWVNGNASNRPGGVRRADGEDGGSLWQEDFPAADRNLLARVGDDEH